MSVFGRAYRKHLEEHHFCPLEANSVGYQGQPLMPKRIAMQHLLADNECVHGFLPHENPSCGCWR